MSQQESKNFTFLEANVPKYRIIGLQGGTRSSKSYDSLRYIIKLCHNYSGVKYSICRDTYNALKASAMEDFFEIISKAGLYNPNNYNKTDHIYYHNGNQIEFFGLDSPGKVQGRKRDILLIDEAIEADWDVVRQLKLRTTGKIIYCFNPSLIEHPIYDDLERDDAIKLITTYKDNAYLNAETIDEIERLRLTDPEMWRVYGEGMPAQARNAVYVHYSFHDYQTPEDFCYGLDVGYQHAMALVEVGKIGQSTQWHELIYQQGMTNADLISAMEGKVNKRVFIHVDSARPDMIEDLKRAGYLAKGADKAVQAGINSVKSRPLIITTESVNLQREVKSYRYNKNRPDEVVKDNDDGMDAGRYGTMGMFGRPNFKTKITIPPKR